MGLCRSIQKVGRPCGVANKCEPGSWCASRPWEKFCVCRPLTADASKGFQKCVTCDTLGQDEPVAGDVAAPNPYARPLGIAPPVYGYKNLRDSANRSYRVAIRNKSQVPPIPGFGTKYPESGEGQLCSETKPCPDDPSGKGMYVCKHFVNSCNCKYFTTQQMLNDPIGTLPSKICQNGCPQGRKTCFSMNDDGSFTKWKSTKCVNGEWVCGEPPTQDQATAPPPPGAPPQDDTEPDPCGDCNTPDKCTSDFFCLRNCSAQCAKVFRGSGGGGTPAWVPGSDFGKSGSPTVGGGQVAGGDSQLGGSALGQVPPLPGANNFGRRLGQVGA